MDELQQHLKESHIEARQSYPVHNLHWTWYETEPHYVDNFSGGKKYDYGSKNLTKMLQFAAEVELRNLDIDYWMSIQPERIPEEPEDQYKVRTAFQAALLKYRPYIYQHSNITAKKLKHARKQQRKTETINS